MEKLRIAAFALLTSIPPLTAAADAVRLEDVTVMALGALDGRAVLKGADGKIQVLKVGDTIPGTRDPDNIPQLPTTAARSAGVSSPTASSLLETSVVPVVRAT